HQMIQQGMALLKALSHRGGKSSDGTGDGCGILMQIPKHFYQTKHNITKPFAVMMTFLPKDESARGEAVAYINEVFATYEISVLKEIEVPTDSTILKTKAMLTEPHVVQYILDMENVDEAKLYTVRRSIEQSWKGAKLTDRTCYISSCSNQTIVYKGLLTPDELPYYYLDLQDELFDSNFCIVHQRFSTNTTPSWNLAQPFRYLAHNGEINTVSGNIQWSNARSGLVQNKSVYPICNERHSDSANLDRTLENMLQEGFNLENAITRLLPKAYENNAMLADELKAYYEYAGLKNEPWDGPAGVILCDGHKLIATLDRNGLRPFRYIQTQDQIILASEIGVLDTPLADIKVASRIQASEILCVDLDHNRITTDEEVKAMLSNQYPYRTWLNEKTIEVPVVHEEATTLDIDFYTKKFKYTKAEYAQELKELLETGKEAIGSFPYTAQLQMLQPNVGLFFDYFKQNFAQVTNPPLDSIREQSVFSSEVHLTSVSGLKDEALTNPIYKFKSPIMTKNQYDAVVSENQFKAKVISLQFEGDLNVALEKFKRNILAVLETDCHLIVLDDEGTNKAIPSLLATSVAQSVLVESGRRLEVRFIVKAGDARLPIHYAMLIAYGADLIYPYFALDYLLDKASEFETAKSTLLDRYLKGCLQTLLKLMAKTGVSTVSSYRGSKVFEVVGLDAELTAYFNGKPTL
ncbi:MAG TPA: glutamate synthase large subunit, partial [Firmicutes bacterium]|nr:glutamate synthase large subunit [Bacillota bacterium]